MARERNIVALKALHTLLVLFFDEDIYLSLKIKQTNIIGNTGENCPYREEALMKTISVIIPMCNAEAFIRQSIQSVLSQTYRDLEILVVDDSSTDQGSEICTELYMSDNRIQFHVREHRGVSATTNYALDIAQGEYVFFLDSDDIFQGNIPVLTGIDTESTYVYLLAEAGDRSADTWQLFMEDRREHGLELQVSISDVGTGLTAGIPKAFPGIRVQPDIFHELRPVGAEVARLERKAEKLISDEARLELENTIAAGFPNVWAKAHWN